MLESLGNQQRTANRFYECVCRYPYQSKDEHENPFEGLCVSSFCGCGCCLAEPVFVNIPCSLV